MRPDQPSGDKDPVGRARPLVEAALADLLGRLDSTPEQDHDTMKRFLAEFTQELAAALRARAHADGASGSSLSLALTSLEAAVGHIRAGQVLDARGELIAARGALVAASPTAPSAASAPAEVCDMCELAVPRWALPLLGGTPVALIGTAPATLLVCPACLRILAQTRSDDELAELLGVDLLSRSLRGLHSRIAGPPMQWPNEQRA